MAYTRVFNKIKGESKMLRLDEIVNTLQTENNIFFHIDNISDYANKIIKYGNAKIIRDESGGLISYILFYNNRPDIFISMVWTNPELRGQGFAKKLILELIDENSKDIVLEVNKNNPAKHLYKRLQFKTEKTLPNGDIVMRYRKYISIMQPYIFPYIGYFHLIEASNLFVFYDDVNYIKKGWINRNKILLNEKEYLFTIPMQKVSQNKLINEIKPIIDEKWKGKFYNNLEFAYKKAPNYKNVMELIKETLERDYNDITDLCIKSIEQVYSYLDKDFNFVKSSSYSPETKELEKADRLIKITKKANTKRYLNAIGGQSLYNKEYFKTHGIELYFIKSKIDEYKQFGNDFIKGLSIIDVLMFNDKKTIENFFHNYELI